MNEAQAQENTLPTLLAQREALDKQIAETKALETADAITQIKQVMTDYGITLEDLAKKTKGEKKSKAEGGKVAPKYRNEAGETWTGRGKKPKWVEAALAEGIALEDLLIEKPVAAE